MFTHLGWSLLGPSGEFDRLASADVISVSIARIFFAVFLIIGVILLINMLIALLSHTYQRTEVRERVIVVLRCSIGKRSLRFSTCSNGHSSAST